MEIWLGLFLLLFTGFGCAMMIRSRKQHPDLPIQEGEVYWPFMFALSAGAMCWLFFSITYVGSDSEGLYVLIRDGCVGSGCTAEDQLAVHRSNIL